MIKLVGRVDTKSELERDQVFSRCRYFWRQYIDER